ncbi:MAG: hypothetical protein ABFC94_06675 [Syntrophomonas sp.]
MIKSKYVIIFMILYVVLTVSVAAAALLTPFISRLAPAAAAATGVNGGFTIPAKIIASTTSGASVASWISLAVPGATAAKVAIAVLSIGGALAADYLMVKGAAWFAANHITIDPVTGNIEETTTTQIPDGNTKSDFADGEYHADRAAALAACQANCVHAPPRYIYAPCGVAVYATYGAATCNGELYPPGVAFYEKYYFPKAGVPTHDENEKTPLTPAQLENKLASSLASENPEAKSVAKAALEVTAAAMDNPSHPVTLNTTTYNNINNYLTSNLTTNQTTNLEAAATPAVGDSVIDGTDADKNEKLTPAQIAAAVQAALAGQNLSAAQLAAAIAAAQASAGGLSSAETTAAVSASLQGQGLTPAQIAAAIAAANPALTQAAVQTAVKAALDDATDVPPVVDPTIIIPDKLSLTTVMQSFVNSIKALPIFATLNGITINTSGSSTLCINLPGNLGGSKCWDGSNMQTGLNMIGSAMLGLTTILSFVGIFKG